MSKAETNQFPICETCTNLKVTGGDIVPYGSTTARLPDDWDCNAPWEGDDADDKIEALFCNESRICPHYKELPKCPKHPNQHIDGRYGCGACENEAYAKMEG